MNAIARHDNVYLVDPENPEILSKVFDRIFMIY